VTKGKTLSLREWFDNCRGWRPRHDVDELRLGIETGLLNEQDEYGMTALHLAVSSGRLEGIKELLRAGADTESRYFRTGETPLLTATVFVSARKYGWLLRFRHQPKEEFGSSGPRE